MRFIRLDTNNTVIAVRQGVRIVDGEIQSDIGEIGQQLLDDGTFIDTTESTPETTITLEEKIDRLQDDIDYLILKKEGVI